MSKEDAAPPPTPSGVVGSMGAPGGVPGGMPGGIPGGTGTAPVPVVKPTPPPKPTGPQRISGGVMQGSLIEKTTPVYPPIAKAAHVSGTVVLHALIGKDGTIKNLTYVSGPEMLKSSALEAVSHWRYKPFLLTGEPTEVDTTISVNFNFGSS